MLFPLLEVCLSEQVCAVADKEPQIADLRELLTELDRLAAEQRSLDLRDPDALERHERTVHAVRQRVARLERSRREDL